MKANALVAMDRGNNRSLICTWQGGGGKLLPIHDVSALTGPGQSLTFEPASSLLTILARVAMPSSWWLFYWLLKDQVSKRNSGCIGSRRRLLKQLEDILKSEEKLEYSLPHENSRNPLILLHCCIAAPRSNCRLIGKNITRYKKGSFSSLLWFFLLTSIKIWSAHFHFIDLKSLFVTTLTQSS